MDKPKTAVINFPYGIDSHKVISGQSMKNSVSIMYHSLSLTVAYISETSINLPMYIHIHSGTLT